MDVTNRGSLILERLAASRPLPCPTAQRDVEAHSLKGLWAPRPLQLSRAPLGEPHTSLSGTPFDSKKTRCVVISFISAVSGSRCSEGRLIVYFYFKPYELHLEVGKMLRDQAARRRVELNPLTTNAISPAQQYAHQTPSSALSQHSLSAQFGYNPSSFNPTPVSSVQQYNPQQWTSPGASNSGGQRSAGRIPDSEGMVQTYLLEQEI